MNTADLAWKIYNIVSGADNKDEQRRLLPEIEDWLNNGEPVDLSKTTVEELANEFAGDYYR